MNKKQNGFALVESLLILVLVAIIGGTGYYVWHSRIQANKSLDQTAKTNQSVSISKKTNTATNKSVVDYKNTCKADPVNKLAILEWHVSFVVPCNLKTMEYTAPKTTESDSYVPWNQLIELGSIDTNLSSDGSCGASGGFLGRITRTKVDLNTLKNSIPDFGGISVGHIGEFYYYYHTPDQGCVPKSVKVTANCCQTQDYPSLQEQAKAINDLPVLLNQTLTSTS